MEREYFHYKELEEWSAGMWKTVGGAQKKTNSLLSAELMRDYDKFRSAMFRALEEWPNSCRHNLTSEDSNRLAWLGHAGCCLAVGSPEENTRCGWHLLTTKEQNYANDCAKSVLDEWLDSNQSELPLIKLMKSHA